MEHRRYDHRRSKEAKAAAVDLAIERLRNDGYVKPEEQEGDGAGRTMTIEDFDAFIADMNDGKVSAEQFKAMGCIPGSQQSILDGLNKKTKGDLLRNGWAGRRAPELKSEKKQAIVDAVMKAARNEFALGRHFPCLRHT